MNGVKFSHWICHCFCCSMYSHEERISGSEEYWFGQLWPFIWLRRQLCSGWVAAASVFCEHGALTDRHRWLELTWRRDVCQYSDCSSHRAPRDGCSHRHAATTAPRWVSPWLNLPSNTGWMRATWCICVCVCVYVGVHVWVYTGPSMSRLYCNSVYLWLSPPPTHQSLLTNSSVRSRLSCEPTLKAKQPPAVTAAQVLGLHG